MKRSDAVISAALSSSPLFTGGRVEDDSPSVSGSLVVVALEIYFQEAVEADYFA